MFAQRSMPSCRPWVSRSTLPGQETFRRREYRLANATSARAIVVNIRDRQYLKVYSTPKSSKYSTPDRYVYHHRNEWVCIEISRTQLRSWSPRYLLRRLQLILGRNSKKPSAKKP